MNYLGGEKMEALYGVMILITFILGLGMGLTIPFFVKKYIKHFKEENKDNSQMDDLTDKINKEQLAYIPTDLLKEWMTGEEVKASDEQ